MGLRAFDVEIRTRDGREVASLPRAYGEQAGTVRSPSSLLPALARKPRAWGESPVRGDFPEGLRTLIDAQDSARRKATFRLLERVGAACGFDAACKAAEHIIGQGRPIDEAALSIMARRIASGEAPADVPAPDLSVYDDFMRTGDGDTLKEREGGKDR